MSVHGPDELALVQLEEAWGQAMVSNDADAIGEYMAADWTIVGPDGGVMDRQTFLALVRSGALSHDVMDADEFQVQLLGEVALVTMRGVSGGRYQGQPFRTVERVTDVWVRREGGWRCVRTHLSTIPPPSGTSPA